MQGFAAKTSDEQLSLVPKVRAVVRLLGSPWFRAFLRAVSHPGHPGYGGHRDQSSMWRPAGVRGIGGRIYR